MSIVLRFHYYSLLQNVTDIIKKCGSYFITKYDRSLDFLLQNATILFQNATVIINCDNFITKRDSYFKMQYLLQIATIQNRHSS